MPHHSAGFVTNRRDFLKHSTQLIGASLWPGLPISRPNHEAMIALKRTDSNFERTPLARPFGFKGNAITNVWQTMAYLESDTGLHSIGLGTQSVLWSDARVFVQQSEEGGNALMFAILDHGLQLMAERPFYNPIHNLDNLLPDVVKYAKKITGRQDLRKTFTLNALVALDNAAWVLYAKRQKEKQLDRLIPKEYRFGLSARHQKVASIPALSYGVDMQEIKRLADQGFFIMKIKIGAPGDQAAMLEKDKAFLKAIHDTIGHYETPHTPDGKIPYYFDANGRYDRQDTMKRFLDYADQIGALEQIAVLEEPFGERNQQSIGQITAYGMHVAADESAHTDKECLERIQQGYNCIAVKAVAKTLSMTLKIAQVAHQFQVPCFCADLTVNPVLVEWNKNIAARLPAFPGLDFGLQETNGWQNYKDWDQMLSKHPTPDAPWVQPKNGVFETGDAFFEKSGSIFETMPDYERIFLK